MLVSWKPEFIRLLVKVYRISYSGTSSILLIFYIWKVIVLGETAFNAWFRPLLVEADTLGVSEIDFANSSPFIYVKAFLMASVFRSKSMIFSGIDKNFPLTNLKLCDLTRWSYLDSSCEFIELYLTISNGFDECCGFKLSKFESYSSEF